MRQILFLWAILLIFSLITVYSNTNKKVELRIGVIKSIDTVHPYVAAEEGYFAEENLTYKIYSFGTSPALAEALAAGEIDVAYMSFLPATVWIDKGVKIKIISGVSRGGDVVCTRENVSSGKIAVSKKGTMTDNVYRAFVKERLPFEPVYGIEPSDMPTALLVTKEIDAILTWEPFASLVEESGGACIFDVGTEWKKVYGEKYQRNVLVASERVYTNRTLYEKVMRIHNKSVEFLKTKQGRAKAALEMGLSRFSGERVEYSSELNWPSMVKMMEVAKREGYISRVFDYDQIVYTGEALR